MAIHPTAFVHRHAIVEDGAQIGAGTRIWAFTHILPGAVIGDDCNICDHVFIENQVRVGNRVTIKSGVQLWDGVTLEDDVFVGPNVTFTNDPFPRSKKYLSDYPQTVVRKNASIGANATILPGISIGPEAMVGAGAVVTRDVPARAIVVGNPAYIRGYVDTPLAIHNGQHGSGMILGQLKVDRTQLVELPEIADIRGKLSFAEVGGGLPFVPKRYFLVYGVPTREVRGEHAHRQLEQFLVCVQGEVSVVVDDGRNRQEIRLSRPNLGLHVGPMVWTTLYRYSNDAVLLVLASERYDANDYIRDYQEFVSEIAHKLRNTDDSQIP